MSFHAKVIGGVVLVMGAAVLFLLFFRSSEEERIEAWLRAGAEAAQDRKADTVVGMLSKSFTSDRGDYAWAEGRIRSALDQRAGFIEVLGCAVEVADGENADATIRLRGYVGKNELWRAAFALRLKKEGGAWKIVSAEDISR